MLLKMCLLVLLVWSGLLSVAGTSGGVIRGSVGGNATIRCRISEGLQTYKPAQLRVVKGLWKEVQILRKSDKSADFDTGSDFKDRLQLGGEFPNFDVRISDLRLNDSSAFWCLYKGYDDKEIDFVEREGRGSVVLVVSEGDTTSTTSSTTSTTQCDGDGTCETLVWVAVGISTAVLFGILLVLLICIIKKKLLKKVVTVTHYTGSEVYEDMRATVRR